MKIKATVLLILLLFAIVPAQENVITIKYYFVEGCPSCEEVKNIITEIKKYSSVNVVEMNVYKSTVYMDEFKSYGFWKVPAVVINGKAKFQGEEEITEENVRGTIEKYQQSYTQGKSLFEIGKKYYCNNEYKEAQIYLKEAKKLFEVGNFDTNATIVMLEDCNSCIEDDRLIFAGDTFLEKGYTEKAREMYSQVRCEDLEEIAETRIDHIVVYDESLQKFETAVEHYNEEKYSQALTIFNSIKDILIGEKKEQCKAYIEKCEKYERAEYLYQEGQSMVLNDPLAAQENFVKAKEIYISLGENTKKYDTFTDAALHFYLGKELLDSDAESASLHFEEAKEDFASLGFQEGVEKCEKYIEESRNNTILCWISFFAVLVLVSILAYLFYFRKKEKGEKNNKSNKKELKGLIEKYANREMPLKEFEKKKKKVIK